MVLTNQMKLKLLQLIQMGKNTSVQMSRTKSQKDIKVIDDMLFELIGEGLVDLNIDNDTYEITSAGVKFCKDQKDQTQSTSEKPSEKPRTTNLGKDQTQSTSEKPQTTQRKMIACPNCGYICEWIQLNAKRPRKKCPKCGKKTEYRLWNQDQKDQTQIPSEKPSEKPRTTNPGKDQSSPPSEKPQTTLSKNQIVLLSDSDVNAVIKSIKLGLNATQMSTALHSNSTKIHRIIQKLLKSRIIELLPGYPKKYQFMFPEDFLLNPGIKAPNIMSGETNGWVKTANIHRLRFKTIMKRKGDTTGAREIPLNNWIKYLFEHQNNPMVPEEFDIHIDLHCVEWYCNFDVLHTTNVDQSIKEIQQRIPYQFLLDRGFDIDRYSTKPYPPDIELDFGELNEKLGSTATITATRDGVEEYHVDKSPPIKTPMIEVRDPKKADDVINVPNQIRDLQLKMDNMTKDMSNLLSVMNNFMDFITGKAKPPSQSPLPNKPDLPGYI